MDLDTPVPQPLAAGDPAPIDPGPTLVFIPAYNEEQNLPAVLDELRAVLPEVDIVVIDDGSADGTARVAQAHGARVVSFPQNRGLRSAIAEGYRQAREGGYDYCGRIDADGQHPPAELRRMLTMIWANECDVAVGSRFLPQIKQSDDPYRPSPERRVGTSILRRLMRFALGQRFHDGTSGMYAVRSAGFELLAEPYFCGAPEVEGLLRVTRAGLRLREVPVRMLDRQSGESKLTFAPSLHLVLTIVALLVAGGVVRKARRR